MFIAFIVAGVFFVIRELDIPYPFFQVRLLKIFSFTFANLLIIVSYGIYFGSIVIVPLWLQEFMDYDAIRAGIAVAPLGIGPMLFSFMTPALIRRIGNLLRSPWGFSLRGFSFLYFHFLDFGQYRARWIFAVSHGARIISTSLRSSKSASRTSSPKTFPAPWGFSIFSALNRARSALRYSQRSGREGRFSTTRGWAQP